MKKAIISGERQAELIEVPDLSPKDDWVVVRIDVTPMCTEYKSFATGQRCNSIMCHQCPPAKM